MSKNISLNPPSVPAPLGGYAQSVSVYRSNQLLVVSGQIPESPDGTIPEDFPAQCRLAWTNVMANLTVAFFSAEDLVKVTTYLADRRYAEDNRAIRQEFLGGVEPASTVVVAGLLDPRWLLEIEATAALPL